MKITIESTTKIVTLNGIECRVWEGETERGVKIHQPKFDAAYAEAMKLVAIDDDEDQEGS